jgi:hypothetical protein
LSQKYDQPNTSSHIFKFAPKIPWARDRNRYPHEGESAVYPYNCSASLPQGVLNGEKSDKSSVTAQSVGGLPVCASQKSPSRASRYKRSI